MKESKKKIIAASIAAVVVLGGLAFAGVGNSGMFQGSLFSLKRTTQSEVGRIKMSPSTNIDEIQNIGNTTEVGRIKMSPSKSADSDEKSPSNSDLKYDVDIKTPSLQDSRVLLQNPSNKKMLDDVAVPEVPKDEEFIILDDPLAQGEYEAYIPGVEVETCEGVYATLVAPNMFNVVNDFNSNCREGYEVSFEFRGEDVSFECDKDTFSTGDNSTDFFCESSRPFYQLHEFGGPMWYQGDGTYTDIPNGTEITIRVR